MLPYIDFHFLMTAKEKIFIQTFGCQMNVHDSGRILGLMESEGYERAAGPADADLVIVNTCSVREKAYQKVRSAVGALKRYKGNRQSLIIAVAGCVARQEGEKWLDMCPYVDIVMGPDALVRVASLVRRVKNGEGPIVDVGFDEGKPDDFASSAKGMGGPPASAFVTIMKGCNGSCSFCIVPALRGKERCRTPGDILEDVRKLVGAGTREVYLLGQTVNSWKHEESSFADLLGMVNDVGGVRRIRYTSPYPGYVTPGMARAHGSLESLCEHIHLPVQSGSNRILSLMDRKYTREQYLDAIALLKKHCPGIAVSTDMIVGYPGETREDFNLTLSLVREVRFDTMFSFKYSPRPNTRASELDDDVPPGEKQERLLALHELADEMTASGWKEDLGREREVLVEKKGREPGQLTGRTRKNRIVNFIHDATMNISPGDFVSVRIEEVLPHSLRGKAAAFDPEDRVK